jgi:DNA-binding IclR family transcriptional regulator
MDHTDEIMAHLNTETWITIADLIEITGLSKSHTHTALRELRAAGKIQIEPEPNMHRWTAVQYETAMVIGGEPMNKIQKI